VVTGGVDTHKDVHVAAVIDNLARILGTESFPTHQAGPGRLLRGMRKHGTIARVGVEGTGSYGAGLARYLAGSGIEVVEVNRPNAGGEASPTPPKPKRPPEPRSTVKHRPATKAMAASPGCAGFVSPTAGQSRPGPKLPIRSTTCC
jgi:hypothetical protein